MTRKKCTCDTCYRDTMIPEGMTAWRCLNCKAWNNAKECIRQPNYTVGDRVTVRKDLRKMWIQMHGYMAKDIVVIKMEMFNHCDSGIHVNVKTSKKVWEGFDSGWFVKVKGHG